METKKVIFIGLAAVAAYYGINWWLAKKAADASAWDRAVQPVMTAAPAAKPIDTYYYKPGSNMSKCMHLQSGVQVPLVNCQKGGLR